MEPEAGIGPATYALRVRCSTTELPGRDANSTDSFRVWSVRLQGCGEGFEWWASEEQCVKREIFVDVQAEG